MCTPTERDDNSAVSAGITPALARICSIARHCPLAACSFLQCRRMRPQQHNERAFLSEQDRVCSICTDVAERSRCAFLHVRGRRPSRGARSTEDRSCSGTRGQLIAHTNSAAPVLHSSEQCSCCNRTLSNGLRRHTEQRNQAWNATGSRDSFLERGMRHAKVASLESRMAAACCRENSAEEGPE